MDKVIDNKTKKRNQKIAILIASATLLSLVIWAIFSSNNSTVEVYGHQLRTSVVKLQSFEELVTADGSIIPMNTVIIDALIGGKVVKKFREDGAIVEAGDTILILENTDLQLDILNRETAVLDMMTNIQHTRNLLDQNMVARKCEYTDFHFQYTEAERQHNLNKVLSKDSAITKQEFLQSENRLQYLKKRIHLLNEAVKKDSIVGKSQIAQLETSLTQARMNLDLMRKKLDDLIVRAPVSGQLSSFNLELGQLINAGENIAQIDDKDEYKMRVLVDQQHSQKVFTGQVAFATINGIKLQSEVMKIYPTVTNNQFTVDLKFTEETNTELKRGQNVTARITLSQPRETLTISRGSFLQSTGGQWVFVVDRAQNKAFRRSIKLGRQNPNMYEITDGLAAGEEVIISNYLEFENYETLILTE